MRKLRENHKTGRFHQGKRVGLGHGLRKVLLDLFFEICQKILQVIGSQCICRTDFDIGIVQSSPLPKTLFFYMDLAKKVEILEFWDVDLSETP